MLKGGKILYKMATTITTVSLSPELMAYATEKKLKLSKIIQEKVSEMMESDRIGITQIKELLRKQRALQEIVDNQRKFLSENKLMEEFLLFYSKEKEKSPKEKENVVIQ